MDPISRLFSSIVETHTSVVSAFPLALAVEPPPVWQLGGLALLSLVGLLVPWMQRRRQRGGALLPQIALGLRLAGFGGLIYAAVAGGLLAARSFSPDVALGLEPIWPWPLVLLASLGLVAMVLGTYPPRIRHLSVWHQRALLGLRLAAAAVLIFAMLRPALQWSEEDKRSDSFVVLTDPSRSMNTKDGPGGISRYQSMLQTLEANAQGFEELAKEIQVARYELQTSAVPVTEWSPEATGDQTAIGFALDELLKESQNRNLVGILLLSDGAQRAMAPYDADPRRVAQRLAELRIPLYTVAYGSSSIVGASMDLIAEDLEVSPTVFVKNRLIVRAKVRAIGAANRDLTVRLLVESRKGLSGEAPKMEIQGLPQKIRPTGNEEVIPVELSYIPEEPGEFRLSVEVVPIEGELLTTNNVLTTYVTVLKGGLNVAYFDVVRPEIRPLRQITESPDIQLDFKLVRFGQRFRTTELEPEWFEPGRYDVFIIGDVPASVFNQPGLRVQPLEAIRRAVEQGAGLLMTGGFHSFGPGGYAETPLADVLPVQMSPTEIQNDQEIDPSLHHLRDLQMLPAGGVQHYVTRLDSPAKNLERWQKLPPLEKANRFLGLKPLGQVLAQSQDGVPLLVAQDVGRGRAMAFAADSTWRWPLAGFAAEHQQFWRQVILWLAHKETEGDSTVWLKLANRRVRPGQPVDMTFGARTPEGQAIEDARFTVEVQGPGEAKFSISPQRIGNEHAGRFLDTQQPGEYTVTVQAEANGQSVGSAQSRFIVYEQDLELYNPAADYGLMEELASTTGGEMIPPEQLGSFLKRLIRSDRTRDARQVTTVTLWDNWFVIVLFVIIMTVEWFYRKSRGLV